MRHQMLDRCYATTCAEIALERLKQPTREPERSDQLRRLEFLQRMKALFSPSRRLRLQERQAQSEDLQTRLVLLAISLSCLSAAADLVV